MAATGIFLLSGMNSSTSYGEVVRNLILFGLGLGSTMPSFTIAAQNAAGPDELGVVTATAQFARSIGATLGATALGSLLVARFGPELVVSLAGTSAGQLPPVLLARLVDPQALLDPQIAGQLRQAFSETLGPNSENTFSAAMFAVRQALATALHDVFLVAACVMLLTCIISMLLPEQPLRRSARLKSTISEGAK